MPSRHPHQAYARGGQNRSPFIVLDINLSSNHVLFLLHISYILVSRYEQMKLMNAPCYRSGLLLLPGQQATAGATVRGHPCDNRASAALLLAVSLISSPVCSLFPSSSCGVFPPWPLICVLVPCKGSNKRSARCWLNSTADCSRGEPSRFGAVSWRRPWGRGWGSSSSRVQPPCQRRQAPPCLDSLPHSLSSHPAPGNK